MGDSLWEPEEDIQAAGLAVAKAGRWEAGGTFGDRENLGLRHMRPGERRREGRSWMYAGELGGLLVFTPKLRGWLF